MNSPKQITVTDLHWFLLRLGDGVLNILNQEILTLEDVIHFYLFALKLGYRFPPSIFTNKLKAIYPELLIKYHPIHAALDLSLQHFPNNNLDASYANALQFELDHAPEIAEFAEMLAFGFVKVLQTASQHWLEIDPALHMDMQADIKLLQERESNPYHNKDFTDFIMTFLFRHICKIHTVPTGTIITRERHNIAATNNPAYKYSQYALGESFVTEFEAPLFLEDDDVKSILRLVKKPLNHVLCSTFFYLDIYLILDLGVPLRLDFEYLFNTPEIAERLPRLLIYLAKHNIMFDPMATLRAFASRDDIIGGIAFWTKMLSATDDEQDDSILGEDINHSHCQNELADTLTSLEPQSNLYINLSKILNIAHYAKLKHPIAETHIVFMSGVLAHLLEADFQNFQRNQSTISALFNAGALLLRLCSANERTDENAIDSFRRQSYYPAQMRWIVLCQMDSPSQQYIKQIVGRDRYKKIFNQLLKLLDLLRDHQQEAVLPDNHFAGYQSSEENWSSSDAESESENEADESESEVQTSPPGSPFAFWSTPQVKRPAPDDAYYRNNRRKPS